jgi:2,3-bisphosphoglycerate-independent phosphoglycerate mutase
MSAVEITSFLQEKIKTGKYDFVVVNYANPDMVGHTGNLKATVKALQVIDNCLEKIYQTLDLNKTTMIITADHGNAELMVDQEGKINKKHTTNDVPLIIITSQKLKLKSKETLADVAPTILQLLNVKKPKEMTGKSLIL